MILNSNRIHRFYVNFGLSNLFIRAAAQVCWFRATLKARCSKQLPISPSISDESTSAHIPTQQHWKALRIHPPFNTAGHLTTRFQKHRAIRRRQSPCSTGVVRTLAQTRGRGTKAAWSDTTVLKSHPTAPAADRTVCQDLCNVSLALGQLCNYPSLCNNPFSICLLYNKKSTANQDRPSVMAATEHCWRKEVSATTAVSSYAFCSESSAPCR